MKKEMKKQIYEEYLVYKEERALKKERFKELPKEQQKLAKKACRAELKAMKAERKAAIKKMAKPEKRKAKNHDKYFNKLSTRPRRYAVRSVLVVLLIILTVMVVPIVRDFGTILSIKLDTTSDAALLAKENGKKVAESVSDEGIILLKNENNILPLKNNKINVFGFSAYNFAFGGGGSGGSSSTYTTDLFGGLSQSGILYNPDLHEFYRGHKLAKQGDGGSGIAVIIKNMVFGKNSEKEPDITYLKEDIIEQAVSYSNTALIVVSSEAVEATDSSLETLKISHNTKALIEKINNHFEHIVVLINSGQQMELGFLDTYEHIDAALWVGTPGSQGAISIGKILKGDVNPSGRLTDTYAYDIGSAPSNENMGDFAYDNLFGMGKLEYEEGIYIGYRFYETYYLNKESEYQQAVQYPFGYGLSYTSFDWTVTGHIFTDEEITVEIRVQNTGTEFAGKDVVQVYFSAPYIAGGIEKSAIELGGYAKTDTLEPGQSQDLTISFPTRDMSSYDMHLLEAYVLEAGTYEIKVAKNVHEPIETLTYVVPFDIVYDKDEVTNTLIKNQFDYANGDLTYLSRNDWENTYPTHEDIELKASQTLIDLFKERPNVSSQSIPVTNADNGILLKDLKGLSYDDPMWEDFLDQLSVEEMGKLISTGAYVTHEIDRLGIPSVILLDGPAGINFVFGSFETMSYPTEVVIASTWNDELAYNIGEAIGMECNAYGIEGWYAPGQNLHRSPQGGRNFEYFSEDPLISGKMSAAMVRGAQSKNIIVTMKHFALNEQEINARSGVLVWANEQAIRELYLRPFEITVKEGHVNGVMSSFIHIGHKWSGGNEELLQNVLRDEWGFVGLVTTDAVLGSFMDLQLAIHGGNDLMLSVLPSTQMRKFNKIYKADPAGTIINARDRVKNICYAIVNNTKALE